MIPSSARATSSLRVVAFAIVVWGMVAPWTARAHLGHVVQRAERYLKLDLSGYRGRLVVSLNLGPPETMRIMERANVDGDGSVSDAERNEYLEAWGDGLREELRVFVDGEPVPVTWGGAYMEPTGPITAADGAVEMVGSFVIPNGGESASTIVVHDGMRVETFDRTDFSFRARDGATLIDTGLGEDPAAAGEPAGAARAGQPIDQFALLARQPYPGSFFATVRVPEAPAEAIESARQEAEQQLERLAAEGEGARFSRATVYAAASLALVVVVVLVGIQRRRRGDDPTTEGVDPSDA